MFNIAENTRNYLLFSFLLFALCLLSFSGLTEHRFDTDDHEWLKEITPAFDDLSTYFSPDKHTPLRPPVDALFALGYLMWGENASAFHMLQIGLHLLLTIQFVYVLRRFGLSFEICLLTGLLFCVNVAHFRALHWIFILNHLLATFFALFFLDQYRRYLYERHNLFPALLMLLLAVFSHPSIVSIAAFALYLTWHRHKNIKRTLAVSWPLLVAIPVFILASFLVSPQSPQGRGILTSAPQIESIFTYLFWFLSRLLTNAHWIVGGVSNHVQTWELMIGAIIFVAAVVLYFRNTVHLSHWVIFCVVTVLPFVHRSYEWQFLPFGPSRQLYVATLGSSVVFAVLIQNLHLYIASKTNTNIARISTVTLILILTASSIYSLRQLEAPSYYTSGRSYIARGNLDTGAILIERALRHKPTLVPPDAYLRLVTSSFTKGISHIDLLNEGLKLHTDHPQLMLLLGLSHYLDETYSPQGNVLVQKAFENTDDKAELSSYAGLALQNLAGYFHAKKEYAKAVPLYEQALIYRPNYPIARFNLANALYRLKRIDQATEKMYQAVYQDPEYENAVQFLGNMLYEQKKYAEAEKIYLHHLTLNRQNPHIYYNLARAQRKQDKLADAVATYRNALVLAPRDADIHLQLADVLHQQGKTAPATDEYLKLLTNAPAHFEALQTVTALLIEQNRTDKALEKIQDALQINGTDHRIWYLLAQTYQAQENLVALSKALQNALTRDPSNPHYRTAYLNLGIHFQQQDQMDHAWSVYRQVLVIDPQNKIARKGLEAIE